MSKFDEILALEEELKTDNFGELIVDNEHKGTKDDPMHMPYVVYTDVVRRLMNAVYSFCKNNPEYGLNDYLKILEDNGCRDLDINSFDVSNVDDKVVMAMLYGIIRGERFCDGLILDSLKSGAISKLIERLRAIIENENDNSSC